MKFIADGMLGKLTRWLRMLGYNVKYSTKLDDAQLMKIAKQERRTLLTKDLQLYQRAIAKGVVALYMEGSSEPERLTELAKRFAVKLDIDMATSRCPKCNTRVKPIYLKKKSWRKFRKTLLAIMASFGNVQSVNKSIGREPIG